MAGEQYRKEHPLYGRWNQFKQCTTNPNSGDWPHHGGRGIELHGPWHKFSVFEAEIMSTLGPCPGPGYKLARIDQSCNFEPGNMEWCTQNVVAVRCPQAVNITIDGETRNIREWCDMNDIYYSTAMTRIHHLGWDPVRAVTKPTRPKSDSKRYNKKSKK